MPRASEPPSARFVVAGGDPLPLLRRRLRLGFGRRQRLRVTLLDTFDWRFWRRGGKLQLEESPAGNRILWNEGGGGLSVSCEGAPRFAADLPAGTVRSRLAAVADVRALLPVGRLRVDRLPVRVLDLEGKIIVRLVLDSTFVEAPDGTAVGPARTTLAVAGLRGYDAAYRRVSRSLSDFPGLAPADADDLERAAAAWGRRPGDYASRFELQLDPQRPAADAVRCILLALLGAITANVDGAAEDIDSEFLHDLRVATRRTRSALSQLKDALGTRQVESFVAEFRWLGGITGTCRDLDVFQIHTERLLQTLRPTDAEVLRPFLDRLTAARAAAHGELAGALRSRRFASLVQRWERFLLRPRPARRARPPIIAVADARIDDAFRRLLRHGEAMDAEPPAADMHRLRIAAKRLRYLLEFFSSLYPDGRVGTLMKRLRRLQDTLGGFQDAVVQQDKLAQFARSMTDAGEAGPETLLAMGRLTAAVERRGEEHRQESAACFATFASPPTRRTVRELVRRRKETC